MEEFEERFITSIINASYPATLSLSLAVLQVTPTFTPHSLKNIFLTSSVAVSKIN
jgi:hypothetical protein